MREKPTIAERIEAATMLAAAAHEAYEHELEQYRAELALGRDTRGERVRAAWAEVVEARELLAAVAGPTRPAGAGCL
jgi:hypothetical protein